MRETIAMREIIANAEGVREVKAKCVSLPQNAGDLATMQDISSYNSDLVSVFTFLNEE